MKNILFLSNNSLDIYNGGIERSTFNLIKYLSQKGYNLFACFTSIPNKIDNVQFIERVVYTGKDINDVIEQTNADVTIFPCGYWYVNILKSYNQNVKCKIISCLHSPPKVGEDIRISENLNRFFNYSLIGKVKFFPYLIYNVLNNIRFINGVRNGYNLGYNNSDIYLLLSNRFFNSFKIYSRIEDTSKLRAIGNALSFDEAVSYNEVLAKENRILFVGRFHNISKRIDLILNTWVLISTSSKDNWGLDLVGDGIDFNRMKRFVDNRGIEGVSFYSRQNPLSFYKRSKIFLMTSKFEGWGMTLNESLQMGVVPIVMDTFESLHDIIVHGYNGFIVKDGDIKAMVGYCELLMSDIELFNTMVRNAIESSERFHLDVIGKKWELLLNTE